MIKDSSATKDAIFDAAIRLFATKGYDTTTMRDIAGAVGIQSSSIYNHYAGKEELLGDIYDYYKARYLLNSKPFKHCKPMLETGTQAEVVSCLFWTFGGLPADIHERMTLITKIVYMRFLKDAAANEIFRELMMGQTMDDICKKLSYAVSVGRIDETANVEAIAEVLLYTRMMAGIEGLSQSYSSDDELAFPLNDESKFHLNDELVKLIPFAQ